MLQSKKRHRKQKKKAQKKSPLTDLWGAACNQSPFPDFPEPTK